MNNLSQKNIRHWKRLKSLDEPSNKQIANNKKVNAIMNELYKTSKTYEHNKKVLQNESLQHKYQTKNEPLFIRILAKLAKISFFCLKCIACFIIGMILLTIIYYLK